MRFFFITLGLWIVGLFPRVFEIAGQDPQGDEILWVQRSSQFLSAIKKGQWSVATSHLGHPGIPAVASMAGVEHVNKIIPRQYRTDTLTAARVGNALFSALLVPVVFWAVCAVWGSLCALVVAALVAFDVQLLAIGRLAHIDSSLAVLVSATVAFYFRGAITGRSWWRVVAGAFWGLSIASKPTAMVLIPSFFIFNVCLARISKRPQFPISWTDVWAVFVGLGTLATIFTRFWHHEGPFLTMLGAESHMADQMYEMGVTLGAHPWALMSAIVGVCSALVVCSHRGSALRYHGIRAVGLLSGIFVSWALVPSVFENFVRYFTRLPDLARFVSQDSGFVWEGIPWGYFGVVWLQTPIFALVLCSIGMVLAVRDVRNDPSSLSLERKSSLLLAAIVFLSWLAVLSMAAKQFVRYVIPALPFFYLFAGYAIYRACEYLRPRARVVASLVFVTPLMCALLLVASLHPTYLNFYNSFLGGLEGAYRRGYPLFYSGHVETLRFLEQEAKRQGGEPRRLAVAGEYPVIKYAYENFVAPKERHLEPYVTHFLQDAEYVIATRQVIPILEKERGITLGGLREVYTSYTQGVPMVSAYEVPPLEFKEPVSFKLFGLLADTGGTTLEDQELGYGDHVMTYALPERHTEGMLFAGGFLRIQPGSYTFSLSAAQVQGAEVSSEDTAQKILSVVIDEQCSREIVRGDVASASLRSISFQCVFKEPRRIELRGYWYGTFPVVLDTLTIVRQ